MILLKEKFLLKLSGWVFPLGLLIIALPVSAGTCGTAANNNYSCGAVQTSGSLCASGTCYPDHGYPPTACPANLQFSGDSVRWDCDHDAPCAARKQTSCAPTPTPTPTPASDTPSCAVKFTANKNDCTANSIVITKATKGGTYGLCSTVSNFTSNLYDAYWLCQKEGGAKAVKFDESGFYSHSLFGSDWRFNYTKEEKCHIGFFAEGELPKNDLSNMRNSCSTEAVAVFLQGDINKKDDYEVNLFDFNLLFENFGRAGAGNVADIQVDNRVDLFDFNVLFRDFGKKE